MKRLAIVAVVLMMAALWADVAFAGSYTQLVYNPAAPSATLESDVAYSGRVKSGIGADYNGAALEVYVQSAPGFGGLSGDYWFLDAEKEGGKSYAGLFSASINGKQLTGTSVATSGKSQEFTVSAKWTSTGSLSFDNGGIIGQATPDASAFAGVGSNPATLVFGLQKAYGADINDLSGAYTYYQTNGSVTYTFDGAGGWKNDVGGSGKYSSRGDGLYNAGSLWWVLSSDHHLSFLVDTSATYAGVGLHK